MADRYEANAIMARRPFLSSDSAFLAANAGSDGTWLNGSKNGLSVPDLRHLYSSASNEPTRTRICAHAAASTSAIALIGSTVLTSFESKSPNICGHTQPVVTSMATRPFLTSQYRSSSKSRYTARPSGSHGLPPTSTVEPKALSGIPVGLTSDVVSSMPRMPIVTTGVRATREVVKAEAEASMLAMTAATFMMERKLAAAQGF